jgi:GNAT superfamily N-acetyltransferase
VADLWLRARNEASPTIPHAVHGDDEVREWFSSHVVGDLELWVAEDDERLAGILVLDNDWLDQLYVEPTMTGQGIGTQLVDLAKRQRPGGLRLWTFASNTGAQRFYERNDFIEAGRTDGDNEEGAPDILYVWDGHAGR